MSHSRHHRHPCHAAQLAQSATCGCACTSLRGAQRYWFHPASVPVSPSHRGSRRLVATSVVLPCRKAAVTGIDWTHEQMRKARYYELPRPPTKSSLNKKVLRRVNMEGRVHYQSAASGSPKNCNPSITCSKHSKTMSAAVKRRGSPTPPAPALTSPLYPALQRLALKLDCCIITCKGRSIRH